MNIFIYSKSIKPNGIKVITDNVIKACKRKGINCSHISSIENCKKNDIVLSYGVLESYENIKKGGRSQFSLLVDAVTLGYLNKIKFYLKVGNIFNYDFFYSIYAYFKFRPMEKYVCQNYEKIVLVSATDIEYLSKSFSVPREKFLCVPNGAYLPESIVIRHKKDAKIRLGLLASWGAKQTYQESAWFVNKYFSRYSLTHPDVELVLAGRGPFINKLRGIPNVKIIGEVPNLKDFFGSIDAFLAVNPKGCGMLNRVLDAFAHRVPLVALNSAMTGFRDSENLYIPFSDYKSFEQAINSVVTNDKDNEEMVTKAYEYILKNNNWECNYNELVDYILSE